MIQKKLYWALLSTEPNLRFCGWKSAVNHTSLELSRAQDSQDFWSCLQTLPKMYNTFNQTNNKWCKITENLICETYSWQQKYIFSNNHSKNYFIVLKNVGRIQCNFCYHFGPSFFPFLSRFTGYFERRVVIWDLETFGSLSDERLAIPFGLVLFWQGKLGLKKIISELMKCYYSIPIPSHLQLYRKWWIKGRKKANFKIRMRPRTHYRTRGHNQLIWNSDQINWKDFLNIDWHPQNNAWDPNLSSSAVPEGSGVNGVWKIAEFYWSRSEIKSHNPLHHAEPVWRHFFYLRNHHRPLE